MILNFGFYGFGVRRGTLLGRGKVPIRIIDCGLFTIATMGWSHAEQLNQMLEQSVSAEQLIIDQAPAVRLYKKRVEAKARKQAQQDFRSRSDYWKEAYEKEAVKANERQQRIYKMQATIETLTEMKKGAEQ